MDMGMSISPQIWQQYIDLVFQDDLIKEKQHFDVIMDDTFIHSMKEKHMDDLMDLFKVLQKYGLKISPHKCQFFKKKIVYMGLEFQIRDSKVCYTSGAKAQACIWAEALNYVVINNFLFRIDSCKYKA